MITFDKCEKENKKINYFLNMFLFRSEKNQNKKKKIIHILENDEKKK
jgi:hypothetical protein